MTVAELIHAYRRADTPRHTEDERHAAWWVDQLGALPLPEFTADLIHSNVQTLQKRGCSPATREKYLRFIRRICRWGVEQSYLASDPCLAVSLPKQPRRPLFRVLNESEEAALCVALGEPYASWVRFAILTGLKQSEQFSLRWRDVNLDTATLFLPDLSTRSIVELRVAAPAVTLLRDLQRLHPPSLWVFPDLRTPARPANVHSFYTGRWESAVRRAGIPHVRWADLRTTCGARLAQEGHPVADIARALRQRETKRAYQYRAWQPGASHIVKPPRKRAELVFAELSPEQLLALIGRDLPSSPLTFYELCHLYAAHHLKARPSREQFERLYRTHWHGWANRLPHEITRKEVRLWFLSLEQSPDLANKGATFLRALFSWGIRMEVITCPNPVERLIRFRREARERFLAAAEVARFMEGLASLSTKPRAFLTTLLLTGARKGEVLQMRWTDLDLPARHWVKRRTKNGTGQLVPLPQQVAEALAQLPRESEWVFAGANGAHWHRTSADKEWFAIRRRLNLDDVRLHDLRRSTASHLAIAGTNLPTIQRVLNHRSLGPTSVYARLDITAVDRALQAQADRFCSLGQQDHVGHAEHLAVIPPRA